MNLEAWIDAELSERLPNLRRSGESQTVEFKQELPAQARDLAKEIAAFATSADGLILLGVKDNGELVGLPGMETQTARDAFVRRITGVCRDIKPPVRPALAWAVESGHVVLALRVSKGSEPLYYVDHRPYIRHASQSRPAEPGEVIEAIRAHQSGRTSSSDDTSVSAFYSRLAGVLARALRWGDTEPEVRSIKPAVDEWMTDAQLDAAALRDLAVEEAAIEGGLTPGLQRMAERLDEIANFTHMLGNGVGFETATAAARAEADALMEQAIRPMSMDKGASDEIRQFVKKMSRKLQDSWQRAGGALFGGAVEEGQRESVELGRRLMEFSYYPLSFMSSSDLTELRTIGGQLVKLGAHRPYMDGGESQRSLVTRGAALASELMSLAMRL